MGLIAIFLQAPTAAFGFEDAWSVYAPVTAKKAKLVFESCRHVASQGLVVIQSRIDLQGIA